MNRKKVVGLFSLIGIILLIIIWNNDIRSLSFKDDIENIIPKLIGNLFLLSIFVERTIEVFLSSLRGFGADELDLEIDELNKSLKSDPTNAQNLGDLSKKNKERLHYRLRSQSYAQVMGVIIGVCVALIGVRILGNTIDTSLISNKGIHAKIFSFGDILFTGMVLAGGSEAFNKIMKVYNAFMNKSVKN